MTRTLVTQSSEKLTAWVVSSRTSKCTSYLSNMDNTSLDLFEETFWKEVNNYADELELPVSYIEEEFCIEGELIKVKFQGTL